MMKARNLLRGSRTFFPRYSVLIIIGLIILFSCLYRYPKILTLRPQGPHQWRQTDCLAFTANYYHNNATFFKPKIYNLLNDNEGKVTSEFPVMYFFIAQLWKIFGKHEWIFRFVNFLFSTLALIAMMKWFESTIKDTFWSIWSALLLFTSVIYVYYTLNFLPNITAFNLVIIGWYFFYNFKKAGRDYYLYLSILVFLLAGLLKISSAISFIALGVMFMHEWTGLSGGWSKYKTFLKPIKFIIPAILTLASWSAWYIYAVYYNKSGNYGTMSVNIRPIWVLSQKEIGEIIETIRIIWLKDYYYPVTQLIFILMFSVIIIKIRNTRQLLGAITILLSFASLFFLILWFSALRYHDYYFIELLIFSVFILLTFFDVATQFNTGQILMNSYLIKGLALIFLIINIHHASLRMKGRYDGWMNDLHKKELSGYEDIEPYLDSLGVGRDQKVISANDPTVDASLYLMDRKGWSRYGTNMKDSLNIVQRIQQGAGWLTLSHDFEGPEYSHWNYFIKEQVGQHRNIKIYRLGMPDENQP